MLIAALLAAALAAGAHPAVIGLAAVALLEPRLVILGAVCLGLYTVWDRRNTGGADAEAAFLTALASELRAGASLRHALFEATVRVPVGLEPAGRLARAGMPMDRIAPHLRAGLAHNGVTAAAALELSAWSGARTATVFEGLAERASEAAELSREQRAATTQARLSAWVVGLAPLVFIALVLAGGGLGSFDRFDGAAAAVIGAGIALEVGGLAVVALILRRESR